jgi:hypothetical protein
MWVLVSPTDSMINLEKRYTINVQKSFFIFLISNASHVLFNCIILRKYVVFMLKWHVTFKGYKPVCRKFNNLCSNGWKFSYKLICKKLV